MVLNVLRDLFRVPAPLRIIVALNVQNVNEAVAN